MTDPKLPPGTELQQAFLKSVGSEVKSSPFKIMQVATPGDAPKIEAAFKEQLPECLTDLRDQGKCEVNVDLGGGDKMKVTVDPNRVAIARTGETPGDTTIKLSQATRTILKPPTH
jgi:hypothetical protein